MVVPADSVMKAPEGIAPEIASSLLYSAGIAYRLLAAFGTLNPGDFLIQNDGRDPALQGSRHQDHQYREGRVSAFPLPDP